MNVKLYGIQWRKQLCETKNPFSEYVENQALQRLTRKRQIVHRENGQRPEKEFHIIDMADKDKESYLLHLINITPHIRHCYCPTEWLKGGKKKYWYQTDTGVQNLAPSTDAAALTGQTCTGRLWAAWTKSEYMNSI